MDALNEPNMGPLRAMFLEVMGSKRARDHPPVRTPPVPTPTLKEHQTTITAQPLKSPAVRTPAPPPPPELGVAHAQIVTEVGKGWFTSKYVHVDLDHWGVAQLFEGGSPNFKFAAAKKELVGLPCCYLRSGSTVVVTGTVVNVEVHRKTGLVVSMEVVPDKGIGGQPEWIAAKSIFKIPEDVQALRKVVRDEILVLLKGP